LQCNGKFSGFNGRGGGGGGSSDGRRLGILHRVVIKDLG
jgi:hypothetical protein